MLVPQARCRSTPGVSGARPDFVATREYNDDGDRCREFTTVTYRHGEEHRHDGVACYDGSEWRTRDG